jgi:hypothetical protein
VEVLSKRTLPLKKRTRSYQGVRRSWSEKQPTLIKPLVYGVGESWKRVLPTVLWSCFPESCRMDKLCLASRGVTFLSVVANWLLSFLHEQLHNLRENRMPQLVELKNAWIISEVEDYADDFFGGWSLLGFELRVYTLSHSASPVLWWGFFSR